VLVSSIMERYVQNVALLLQYALGSCIAGSGVQRAYCLQLRLSGFAAAM